MPMGKGTYGSKKGRPAKKLTASQKKLPSSLQKKIMASKKHFPKDFCTDYEADKLISSLAPSTLDKLEKIGKDYKVDRI